MCQRNPNLYLINSESGKCIQANCKSYACAECGPKKKYQLKKALTEYLQNWKVVRFWTFTLKSDERYNIDEHYNILRECWRRFLIYMRRNMSLKASKRQFEFIKVIEKHKSGYFHLHVFMSEYLPWDIVQNTWDTICSMVLGDAGHCGSTYVKMIPNYKTAVNYITKYITKAFEEDTTTKRKYSKSVTIILFPKVHTDGKWQLIKWKSSISDLCAIEVNINTSYLEINKRNFTEMVQTLGLKKPKIPNIEVELI